MRTPLLLLALLLSALSDGYAQENLHFQLDSTWEMDPANVSEVPNQYLIMEFVKKGQRIDNWTELVTIQNFNKKWGRGNARETYEALREVRESRCAGATQWEVLSEDKTSILYESIARDCGDQPNQRELVRLLFGRNNRYRVSYATKGDLGTDQRAAWIGWLSALALVR